MLLLHGISSCAVDYLPLGWHLRGECSRVICIDWPSHGLSVSSSSLTLDQLQVIMVEAVRAVLDHLDIQRVLLAGNSLGGMVAARYASKYSKSLAGLILLSPAGAPLSNAELNEIKESFDIKTLSDGSVFVDKVLGRRSVPFGIRHFMGWAARERAARPSVRAILTQADLQMKIQEAEKNGASLHLKVYADSPEIGVMRDPEDVDVLGVTGDAFKGKKYYLCDDYRPSNDGAYGGWNRLYGSVFSKLRDSGCCVASYFRRKSGKKNHRTGYYIIIFFHGRLREVRADESSDDSLSGDGC